jgi:hypothetical protein
MLYKKPKELNRRSSKYKCGARTSGKCFPEALATAAVAAAKIAPAAEDATVS